MYNRLSLIVFLLQPENSFWDKMPIFRCVLASLYEGLSVRPSVRPSIGPSVGRSRLRKKEQIISFDYVNDPRGKLSLLDASSHLYMRVCPSVQRSVRPSVRHTFIKNKKKSFSSK